MENVDLCLAFDQTWAVVRPFRSDYAMRSLLVLLFGLIALPSMAATINQVDGLRQWASPDYTRLVIELGGPVEYQLFMLDNPPRVVVDLKRTRLRAKVAPITEGRGLIAQLRTGVQPNNGLRVVMDLKAAARPKSFFLTPAGRHQHRLVVDLYAEGEAAPTRSVSRTVETKARDGLRDIVIAIDAGHGGEDPGAIGPSGTYEKTVVLKIAQALEDLINQTPGLRAEMIRTGDYFIPHRRRFTKARELNADLFISIHADAFKDPRAGGSSVFILSPRGASSEAARWLADSENKSELVGGVSLADKDSTVAAVLLDLSQGATLEASHAVAQHVLTEMGALGKVHKRYVERAGFAVLRSPDVPSILIETGFISNPAEEKRLRDPEHRRKLARSILNGVHSYFAQSAPPDTWIARNARRDRHVVSAGENLSAIAQRHGVSVQALRHANRLNSDLVQVGKVLTIPTGSVP